MANAIDRDIRQPSPRQYSLLAHIARSQSPFKLRVSCRISGLHSLPVLAREGPARDRRQKDTSGGSQNRVPLFCSMQRMRVVDSSYEVRVQDASLVGGWIHLGFTRRQQAAIGLLTPDTARRCESIVLAAIECSYFASSRRAIINNNPY